MTQLIWKAAVFGAVIAMVVVNALANALPINGLTTGAVSDSYPIYFVPAGYVFSIWGLIYLAVLAFAVAQAFAPSVERVVAPMRPVFVVSCLANAAWIFAWHHLQLGLSVGLMGVLLGCLIVLYRRSRHGPGRIFQWTVAAPMSLYLGWICVATIANLSAFFLQLGWSGAPFDGTTWAAVMMVVATGLIVWLALTHHDAIPPLVLIWALAGILARFPSETRMVVVGAGVLVVLAATVAWVAAHPLRPAPRPA